MKALGAAKYGVRLVLVLALLCAARTASAQSMEEFFDDSVVHDIRLSLNSKDWAALKQNYKENIYYPAALKWRDVNVSNVGIRSRGLGSRSATKPGLRVDIDRYNANQTFIGLKSFVLDNLVQDPSMLRERLSMAFFRRLGLPAPREAHARLFINDTSSGSTRSSRPSTRVSSAFIRRRQQRGHGERRLPVRVPTTRGSTASSTSARTTTNTRSSSPRLMRRTPPPRSGGRSTIWSRRSTRHLTRSSSARSPRISTFEVRHAPRDRELSGRR